MFEHRSTLPGVAEHAAPAPREANAMPGRSLQRVDSHRLLGGQRELVIEHAGQEYHLRLTRNDKLILTK